MTVRKEPKSIEAQVSYWLEPSGPCKFSSNGKLYDWAGGTAIVRRVCVGDAYISSEIVAIVGSGTGLGPSEVLNLRDYLQAGGTIGVNL